MYRHEVRVQQQRRKTATVEVGGVPVGSSHPIVVQSMTNTDTADPQSTAEQVAALAVALLRHTTASAMPLVRGLARVAVSRASGAIVEGVRLSPEERSRTRVMLLDRNHRVIAASGGHGLLQERFALRTEGRSSGLYRQPDGTTVAFHLTPGYESYRGLGWYGVLTQAPA